MRTLRLAAAAATVSLFAAGCAEPGTGTSPGSSPDGSADAAAEFERRAAEVADAWRGSDAAEAWRTGLVLLEPPTVLPEEPADDEAAAALHAGWLRTDLELSAEPPAEQDVRLPDGEMMSVPVISAADGWQEVFGGKPACPDKSPLPPSDGGDPDEPVDSAAPCTVLTVTDVQLGAVTVTTNRGPAELPAWQFEIDEVDGALAHVAVAPGHVSSPPRLDGIDFPHHRGLQTAMSLAQVDGAELAYQLGIGACDIDVAPLAYETDDLVVLGGTARLDPTVTACTDQLVLEEVSVTLDQPLDVRPVLATTGEVLSFGRW